jgi:fused signal recognition particle receptor
MSFFQRLKQGLFKTTTRFSEGWATLFLGKKEIDEATLETLETYLLSADVGIQATSKVMATLTAELSRRELADSTALRERLKALLLERMAPSEKPLQIDSAHRPFVILMVGINGAGKTTTIGKLAKKLQQEGKSVMLAAGDTFRAAAVEQLQTWGERNNIPVISQGKGADPSAVIYDALSIAAARQVDVLLVDTAGRLQTQQNLMAELAKVVRVIKKKDETAPHEILMVLDGSIGQNALSQVKQFSACVPVSGLVVTKLDGSAKGGVLFAIAEQTGLPLRFIGVGEALDDLQVFNAEDFVEAIFELGSSTP